MDDDHEQGLDEQRSAKVGAEPVVHFKDAGDEHDERNIEGEAGRAAGAVHAVDLVAIAGDWAGRDAVNALVYWRQMWIRRARWGSVQDGCNVLHNGADEEHGGSVRSYARRRRCRVVARNSGRNGPMPPYSLCSLFSLSNPGSNRRLENKPPFVNNRNSAALSRGRLSCLSITPRANEKEKGPQPAMSADHIRRSLTCTRAIGLKEISFLSQLVMPRPSSSSAPSACIHQDFYMLQ